MITLGHDELVRVAVRWLRGRKCATVLSEVSGGWSGGESPDAIGYYRNVGEAGPVVGHRLVSYRSGRVLRNGLPLGVRPFHDDEAVRTVVVEAKTSLSDFHADRRKPFRRDPAAGMGSKRYYLCPDGLIVPARHDLGGWGLLYATTGAGTDYRRPRVVTPSREFWPKADARELGLLVQWSSIVEMVVGNTPGDVWGSAWKCQLKQSIVAAGAGKTE